MLSILSLISCNVKRIRNINIFNDLFNQSCRSWYWKNCIEFCNEKSGVQAYR